MGKSKSSKRFGGRRQNPAGLLTNLEFSEEIQAAEEEAIPSVIGNIVDQLKDPSKEEKVHGCVQMAKMVSQPKAIELFLKHDVVKIAAPLFLDECVDVQRSALGAMRNMSLYGEEKVCDVMIKKDITTPLSAVIKKFADIYGSGQEHVKRDTISLILFEAVELFSNLCENNSRALQLFNREGILVLLLPLLDPSTNGYSLANAVAQCLQVVSEKNAEVSKVCRQPEVLAQLTGFVAAAPENIDAVLFRTRVTGVILNLSEIDLSQYYDNFLQVASEVLDTDHLPLIAKAVECNDDPQAVENNKTDIDLSQQDIDKLVTAQRGCLEMIANLSCGDDEWEEMEEDNCGDSAEEDLDEAGDGPVPEEAIQDSLCLSSEIHTAFLKHNLLNKVMKKAHPLEQSQISSLKASPLGKSILQRLEDLQSRALLCMGNLISALCGSADQPQISMGSIWTELYGLSKSYQDKNEDFLWAITSAMRSVLHKLSEGQAEQIKTVSTSDLDFLVQLGTSSSDPETQINTIRMISTIGCVLATDPTQHAAVKTIGELLLRVCRSNENVVVLSEALDSLFDVFKEDETDPVAKEINLVQSLTSIHPTFKTKVSKERKNLGEHYGIVMMARDNLMPFIKYKRARKL